MGNRPLPTALPLGIGNREWGIETAGVPQPRSASRRALPKGVARFPQLAEGQRFPQSRFARRFPAAQRREAERAATRYC